MDGRQEAARQVIEAKKAHAAGDPNANNLANTARQNGGLDDSRYGSGVTLADALSNYNKDFGQSRTPQQGNNQPMQQQSSGQQQQYQQQSSGGGGQQQQQGGMSIQDIFDMMQQSSSQSYEAQKAQMDSALSQQLAGLEAAMSEAVANGEMSVREAQAQFEAQKKQVEQSAYQQGQATKAYGNEMGIGHSQQMVGLQQGDAARTNDMNNANMSDRDRRINDVRDRINMIQQQTNIAKNSAVAQHGYGLAGAQAQANSQLMGSMADLMGKDYFSGKDQQFQREMQGNQFDHAYNMLGRELDNDIIKMSTKYGLDLKMMDKEQLLKLERDAQQNKYTVENMGIQQGYTLENIMTNFNNTLAQMQKQNSFTAEENRKARVAAASNVRAQIEANEDQWEKDMRKYTPGTKEYEIYQNKVNFDRVESTKGIINEVLNQQTINEMTAILTNPMLTWQGEKPIDYSAGKNKPKPDTAWSGMYNSGESSSLMNMLTGFSAKTDSYNSKEKAKQDAINKKAELYKSVGR